MRERFAPKEIIPETQREWKQRKRREWRAVMKAADTFLSGAAYTPADDHTKVGTALFYPNVLSELTVIKRALSYKSWGR